MKTILKAIGVAVLAAILYLSLWPVPVDPQVWDAPEDPGYVGPYAPNDRLAEFASLPLDGLTGPEAVTQNAAGDLYATTHEGWIVRWLGEGETMERWIDVGGRPLGIDFDAQGNLWVANAYFGLQKITPAGEVTVETNMAANVAIRYADDLVVTPDGKIYFSDASTKFAAEEADGTLSASLLDIMEHGLYGRILVFDPADGSTRLVMRDLSFANGVTTDAEGNFLLVAETGGYRIWKHWLKGDKQGQTEVLMENLPGFPDNVHIGKDGRFWVGFTTKRAKPLDDLSGSPFLRKVVQRMPEALRPGVEAYGHVIAIDGDGNVLESLQDPQGAYPATTGVWESEDYLYVTSLTAPVLARYSKADLGL